jgi:hypothetical protein
MKQALALGVLIASLVGSLLTIPPASWSAAPFDPCHVGVAFGIAVVAILIVIAVSGARAARLERPLLALFLAGMPLPYILTSFGTAAPPAGSPLSWPHCPSSVGWQSPACAARRTTWWPASPRVLR